MTGVTSDAQKHDPMDQKTAAQRLSQFVVSDPLSPMNQCAQASAARLKVCLEMSDEGVLLKEATLSRKHPNESTAQIRARLLEWLRFQPDPGQDFTVLPNWPRQT
jgi:hypothetical protein